MEKAIEKFLKLINKGNRKQAEEFMIKEAKGREDKFAEYLHTIGINVGSEDNYPVALYLFEIAQKIGKSNVQIQRIKQNMAIAHNNYAILLRNRNKFKESEYHYKKALRIDPDRAEAHNNYAILLRDENKFKESEYHYKEALRINLDYAEAHNNYALLLGDMKRFEESEYHYKEALRINFEDAETHYNYANLVGDMKRFEESEYHYKEALRIDPDRAEAHNNYALLLKSLERFEESEYHYKEALRINPDYAEVTANLGFLYFTKYQPEEALEQFMMATSLFKNQNKNFDSMKMKAFVEWAKARNSWRNFISSQKETHPNLKESQKYYQKSARHFKEINLLEYSSFLEFISHAIYIGKDFLLSLNSETLTELKDNITEVYERFLPKYQEIKEVSFPDIELLNAQFTCIETLTQSLHFKEIKFKKLYEALDIFSNYEFSEPYQATTALFNFVYKLKECKKEYRTLEQIPITKQKELLLMAKPFSALDSITTMRIDRETGEKYTIPYKAEFREMIREELVKSEERILSGSEKIIREELKESEMRLLSEFKQIFEKFHHELIEKMEALNDAQLTEFRNTVSEIMEKDFQNIEDLKKKKENEEKYTTLKKVFRTSKDVLTILGSIASIYTMVKGGNSEEGINQALLMINNILSKIEKI